MVKAGQIAYAESYRWVYLTSIAFEAVSIIASCFLGQIDQYMDDHVAVVMHGGLMRGSGRQHSRADSRELYSVQAV